jgi:hypothetical protein
MSTPLLGQQRGDGVITGQVQLPGGMTAGTGIPATVRSTFNGGVVSGQRSDNDGNFRFENVPAGQYYVFAAARVATVSEQSETMSFALPVQGPLGLVSFAGARGAAGTFFRGAVDVQNATPITVSSGNTTENVHVVLAPGSLPDGTPPMRIVRGRFVADGGGIPTIGSNILNLILSDGPANLFSEVAFMGGFRRPAADTARFEQLNGPKAVYSTIRMPSTEDGEFRLLLPEGTWRVSPQGPMKTNGRDARYYIKNMSFGATDLLKDLMTLSGPNESELVITLARCTQNTATEPMCQ